jgi:hypothetical protein
VFVTRGEDGTAVSTLNEAFYFRGAEVWNGYIEEAEE